MLTMFSRVFLPEGRGRGGGGAGFLYKRGGVLVGKINYVNRVNKTNWKYIIFNISSSATLKETFVAKYNGVLPRNTLSETKIWNLLR